MHITHSYVGTAMGRARCQFFLLYQDYVDAESTFAKQFGAELERFARSMGDDGWIVKPFLGDIESAKADVLHKDWTEAQRLELNRTPSLLMIETDFADFNPRTHKWALFTFGTGPLRSVGTDAAQLRALFQQISDAVRDHDVDPFDVALGVIRKAKLAHGGEVFGLKPGMFGVSVDLRALGRKLKGVYRHPSGVKGDV